MASTLTMLLSACWFLLQLSWVSAQQCPTIDSIFPPSGTTGVTFIVRGSNLDSLANIIVDIGFGSTTTIQVDGTAHNATHLQFVISDIILEAGLQQVRFVASDPMQCPQELSRQLELRQAIVVSTLAPTVGQSGSIIQLRGSFPPRNGDNSTVIGVRIGDIPADVLVVPSQATSLLVVQAGPSLNATSNANIVVISNYSSFSISNTFTYTTPANITMVTPSLGQLGTRVVITGENLEIPGHTLAQVLLAGNEATIESRNNTMIICVAQSGPSANGSVVLNYTSDVNDGPTNNVYDGPTIVRNNSWQQLADGVINRIVPSAATTNQTILACGERLLGGGNEIVSILIGDTTATEFSNTTFTIANLTCVNITLPLGLMGSLAITLITDTGAIITSTVNVSIASITSTSRTMGQYGTRVNISGYELFGNLSYTTVMLAGVDAVIEMADNTSKRWIVARAGRPPLLSRTIVTLNCTTERVCTPMSNITSDCPNINCSTSFSNATFLNVSCLNTCFSQDVSLCFTMCSVNGTLNQTCFLQCENSTAITNNSDSCFNNCSVPCCVNVTMINCTNVTTCVNVSMTEMFEGSFSGQVAVVTEELGLTFNLTNSSVLWTYNISGRISSVTPSFGQLGTRVALNGTNLYGYGTSLQQLLINGTMANTFFETNSSIVFGAPNISNGSSSVTGLVDIELTSDSGAIVELSEGFQYLLAGVVTNLVPAAGQVGTYVNIIGNNLLGYGSNVTSVMFGGQLVDVINASNSTIFVRINMSRNNTDVEQVNVTVMSDTFAIVTSAPNAWSFLVEGRVTRVVPSVGQAGTYVTLMGTNLLGNGSNIISVHLDGILADVLEANNTVVRVRISTNNQPRQGSVPGEVRILADTGAIVMAAPNVNFTLRESGLITGFSPRFGREGTYINITGINLHAFGGEIINATVAGINILPNSIQFNSSNPNTVTVRAGPSTTTTSGNIELFIDTGPIVLSNTTYNFTYAAPGNISMVTPSSGVEGIGVLITGDDLYITNTSLANVFLADALVDRVVVGTPTIIAVIAGQQSTPITSEVLITASDGSFVRGSMFTYDTPHLLNIMPSSGQFGTTVTISLPPTFDVSGGNLSVLVDYVPATILNSDSTAVAISIPQAQRLGSYAVDIIVENINGELARLTEGFTYLLEGVVIDVTPESGQQGTVVTVAGDRLLGGGTFIATATVAGLTTTVNDSSDSTVVLTVSNNIDGTAPVIGDVVLTADSGAIVRQQRAWTGVVPAMITGVQPTSGQFGTIVNITGSNLIQDGLEVSTVLLAGVVVYNITSVSSTLISVRASNGSANLNGPVRVELETGAYYVSSVMWMYSVPTTISRVFPEIGAVGSTIMIQLADFNSEEITMVTIDNITTNIIAMDETSVNVTVSAGNYSSQPVTIVVETASGLIVTRDDAVTIEELGNIISVSPRIIQQGIKVTITGENLLGRSNQTSIQAVWLAGVSANRIIFYNSSLVIVEAGYTSTNVTGNIRILLNNSASIIGDLNTTIVSYYRAEIFSVTPSSGYNATRFNISGINLIQPNSRLAVVMIGDINATVEQYNYDYIIARAGEPSEGDVNVNLTVSVLSQSDAFIESPDSWTYNTIPVITDVEPNMTAAGNNVTILGTDLPVDSNLSRVLIGGITVDIFDFNETMIQVQLSFSIGDPEPQIVEVIYNDGTVITSDPIFSYDETVDNSIISVTPSVGQNGTVVTIVFNNTLSFDISSVHLVNVMAIVMDTEDEMIINANTTMNITIVTVMAGYGDDEIGDVLINTTNGMVGLEDGWQYLPVLNGSAVTPERGQQGTEVTITVGPSLLMDFNISRVTLAGINATILDTSDTAVVVEAGQMLSATNLSHVILYLEEEITLRIPNSWTYLAPINVSRVSNNRMGYYGSVITIYGVNFLNGESSDDVNITEVILAGSIRAIVIYYNDTIIECNISQFVNSSGGPIVGPIIVNNSLGFSVNTSGRDSLDFTYVQVNVMSVSPNRGQNGTEVTIQGVGLLAAATNIIMVWLNDVPVRSIISANNSAIIVQADYSNMSTPLGNITYLTDTNATVTAPQAWYYVAPAAVSSITPANGTEGTVVTIRGTALLAGSRSGINSIEAIYLDGVEASTVLIAFDSVIQVVVGYQDNAMTDTMPGAVSVSLSSGATWTSSNALFTHLEPGSITMVTPLRGQNGTIINITGSSLYPEGDSVMSITLAGVSARIEMSTRDFIQVRAGRPATLESFIGPVVIQATSGALLRYANNFTYLQEGIIFSVTPLQGQQGTRVQIQGQDLFGGGNMLSRVWLAGVEANISDGNSNNSYVMVTALNNSASNDGNIMDDVLLISDTGAHVRRINGWEYVQRGVINEIRPGSGQYGTNITIRGMRLRSGAAGISRITIGEVEVDNISGTDTMITGRAGNPNDDMAFDGLVMIISSDGGILMSNYTWSYNERGVITNFEPMSGGNNQNITISGTNLLGSGTSIVSATVATIPAMVISYSNTGVTIMSEIVRVQNTFIGPIVLIADTGAIIESSSNYTFRSPCNITQFINDTAGDIECIDCDSLCGSCVGPTASSCIQCAATAFTVQLFNNGTRQCTEGCAMFATEDRQCVGLCGAGQYENISDVENVTFCIDCHEMCAPNTSCSGPGPTECVRCRNFEHESECIESCPSNTYADQNRTCLQCHEQCDGCDGPTANDCRRCNNFVLSDNTTCVDQCPLDYYANDSTCLPCDLNCQGGCRGRGPLECTNCKSAGMRRSGGIIECLSSCNSISMNNIYYLDNATLICEKCSDLCSPDDGCTGPSDSDCRTCRNGTYNYMVNSTCVRDCGLLPKVNNSSPYYNDEVTGTCELCDESCGNLGCKGPGPSNCNPSPTSATEAAAVGTFEAGTGTIIIVIVVCILLLIVVIVLVMLLIQYKRHKGKYSYPQVQSTELTSRYTAVKETEFSKPGKSGATNVTSISKSPMEEPTADDMYTDMSGTEDTMKRPLTGASSSAISQPAELYIDVPNSPQAPVNQDVGGEEYIDVPTPGGDVITNPGFQSDALYEETDQAIESAKAYVKLQKKEAPPTLPPTRSKPSIPIPTNPLEDSVKQRLTAEHQQQQQQEAIYEEGPIEEQLYDAIGGGAPEPPPPFKPNPPGPSTSATKVGQPKTPSATNLLPLPPK